MTQVSIIIPVYNVEKYLPACLDSVLAQTFRDFEVICVDDHSPDRSGMILDQYAEKDSRIRVIHLPENRRQGYARNLGMDQASGRYIYLLDSDDMIREDTIEKLYRKAEEDDLQGIFFNSSVIFETEELYDRCRTWYTPVLKGDYPEGTASGSVFYRQMMRAREYSPYIQRTFWKASFLRENEIRFPEVEQEDELFTLKAFLLAERMCFMREEFFIRRFRENSVVTSKPAPKNFYGYFVICQEIDRFLRDHQISLPEAHRGLAVLCDVLCKHYDLLCYDNDLESLFTGERLAAYRQFRLVYESSLQHLPGKELLKTLSSGCRFVIYGNDYLCGRAYRSLKLYGYEADGFLMDKKLVFYGKEAVTPDTYFGNEKNESLVILAFEERYMAKAEDTLAKYGISGVRIDR